MKAIGVIPARWGSTRFEGKPLAAICGKPMIQHVWERARQSQRLEDVWIACDDPRIFKAAQAFGAKAVMTSPEHPSGTERIAEAVGTSDAKIIVNIQGDEPLIQASLIDAVVQSLATEAGAVMATAVKITNDPAEINNPNVVKVAVDAKGNALYFSRAVIPFHRFGRQPVYYKHVGIYAYRKEFLLAWKDLPPSALERSEQLEQLRVLEAGYRIKTVVTDVETVGVDTPADIVRAEVFLKKQN